MLFSAMFRTGILAHVCSLAWEDFYPEDNQPTNESSNIFDRKLFFNLSEPIYVSSESMYVTMCIFSNIKTTIIGGAIRYGLFLAIANVNQRRVLLCISQMAISLYHVFVGPNAMP